MVPIAAQIRDEWLIINIVAVAKMKKNTKYEMVSLRRKGTKNFLILTTYTIATLSYS